jgi:hypothetical protein
MGQPVLTHANGSSMSYQRSNLLTLYSLGRTTMNKSKGIMEVVSMHLIESRFKLVTVLMILHLNQQRCRTTAQPWTAKNSNLTPP